MMEQKRTCRVCKEGKILSEFTKHKTGKNGYDNICKKCNCNKSKAYAIKNKEKIKSKRKIYVDKYYEENKDTINGYHKIYYINNLESKKEYAKKYNSNENNKENKRKVGREYSKRKRKTDPEYKLKSDMRKRLYDAIKKYKFNKEYSTLEYLGVSFNKFIKHLEQQFLPEMNWDNHGKVWEIDHIIPIASFNFSNKENIKKCFHYTNHQPLFKTTKIAESFGYISYTGNRNKYKNIFKYNKNE